MSIASQPKTCPKCGAAIPAEAPQGLCPACLLHEISLPTDVGQNTREKPTPPSLEELTAAFPQLEIIELIGQGGMGFVFKARQPKLDRFVALKILPQSLAADLAFAERFTREGRLLARLNHPNIVTVHDFGQAKEFFYLLMEYVDGVNLRQAMRAGRFTAEQALAVVPKICEALQFAHNEGILHRDIKPENILLDTKGRVKIADFGIAKLMSEAAEGRARHSVGAESVSATSGAHGVARPTNDLTHASKTLGTPNYMAPEQLATPGTVDHRADIYSLGVVFYEMLTGELPRGQFVPPSQKSAADPRLDDVVLRALEKEPNRRTQSAGEVKTQVETIATNPTPPVYGTQNLFIKPKSFARRGVLVGTLVFLLVVLITATTSFLLPKTYRGMARLKVETEKPDFIRTEIAISLSDAVLEKVVKELNLSEKWKTRRGSPEKLKDSEALMFLKSSLIIESMRNTSLMTISFYGPDPYEAAEIANAIVESYAAFPRNPSTIIQIVDKAVPNPRAVRPNIYLNIAGGIVVGGFLGVIAMFLTTLILRKKNSNPVVAASLLAVPNRFWRRFALIAGLILLAVILIPVLAVLLSFFAYQKASAPKSMQPSITVSNSLASAETWSPTNAPDEKVVLQKIVDEASDLMSRGRYEEALQRLIWHHNHAQEFGDNWQNAVRLTSALATWEELSRRYPKAREALIEIRDKKTREILQGRGYLDLFHDVQAINQQLQNDAATVGLFKTILKTDPKLAQKCYFYAEQVLMQNGEYQLCLDMLGGAKQGFDSLKRSLETQRDNEKRMAKMNAEMAERLKQSGSTNRWSPPTISETIKKSSEDYFASGVSRLVEILIGTRRKPEAEKIRDEALVVLNDARLKTVVSDAEEKISRTKARTSAISPEALAEPPKLQFLAWQDEWKTKRAEAARHTDGSTLTNVNELQWLEHVSPGTKDISNLHLDPEPRFLHLWFSHPLFAPTTFSEVTVLDEQGQIIPSGSGGSLSSAMNGDAQNGGIGWLTCTKAVDMSAIHLTQVTVRLRYAIGSLEKMQDVSVTPKSRTSMTLEGGGQLNGLGQTVDGNAFVSIAVNPQKLRERKFGAVAVTKDGRELLPSGGNSNGTTDGTGVGVESFEFDVPLNEVAKFRIGTRPIRTLEWKDVLLEPVEKTDSSTLGDGTNAFQTTLTNGVEVEVIGVTHRDGPWWKPDGTAFSKPPTIQMPGWSSSVPMGFKPENEFIVYFIEKSLGRSSRSQFLPRPTDIQWSSTQDLYPGNQASVALLYFTNAPNTLDYRFSVVTSEWERIAIFDGARTRELIPGVKVICEPPFQRPSREFCFQVMHNLEVEKYALKLTAYLTNNSNRFIPLIDNYGWGEGKKELAVMTGINPSEVKKYVIERALWTSGKIKGIALRPKLK